MIGAVVLAAGRSQRMGRPKMALPWGETTVIGWVVEVLLTSGVEDIVIAIGGARKEVESALEGLPVRIIYNPDYADGEMIRSLQVGLAALDEGVKAALVVLGDQPQIEQAVVEAVIGAYEQGSQLVVPSYQMRRGHPWLAARSFWDLILQLQPPETLRDFLKGHASEIAYIGVNTPSIFQDLDTPDDYHLFRPR